MIQARDDPVSVTIYINSALSLFFNILLLIVYFRCPLKKIKSYKYFFLLTVLEDFIFTASFVLLIPLVVSNSSFIIFFATGVDSGRIPGSTLLSIFTLSFFTSLVLVTNSFLYRYLQLCRNDLFQRCSVKKTILIACLINLIITFNIAIAMYKVFWPDEEFVQLVTSTVSLPGVDIRTAAFIGFSLTNNLNTIDLLLLADLVVTVVLMVLVNVFCAKEIVSFLRNASSQSKTFMANQRHMFILLLLQTACPLVFLQIPWFFSVVLLFCGISTNTFTTGIISISISLYPISNPIVIMAFMKDYRNCILTNLKLRNPSQHMTERLVHRNVLVVDTLQTASLRTSPSR
uniref:G_PROTEIN_RECEP_F1_2 domain-containing protein n=1 Tax=Haemonchus contortus TaxID=6289 RepID=A0A7I4YJV0_HAECO